METRKITKEAIYKAVEDKIKDTEYFIVQIVVNPNNQILVEIDSKNGVSIDFCVELSKYISSLFEEEIGEYELEVASAGISQPFKVLQQYEKFIGKEVEVLALNGLKYTGTLLEVSPENFTVRVTHKLKLEGAKRKTEVTEDIIFNYNEIKYTKYNFRF
jgi:ribosome maturation factor RimP